MPFIAITVPAGTAIAVKRNLAASFTEMVAAILGKRREVTSVLVRETEVAAVWTIGAATAGSAAHAEIAITAGTNREDEKAEMIRRAHAALAEAVPDLPEATYVVIREIAAGNWGYGGRTQGERRPTRSTPA